MSVQTCHMNSKYSLTERGTSQVNVSVLDYNVRMWRLLRRSCKTASSHRLYHTDVKLTFWDSGIRISWISLHDPVVLIYTPHNKFGSVILVSYFSPSIKPAGVVFHIVGKPDQLFLQWQLNVWLAPPKMCQNPPVGVPSCVELPGGMDGCTLPQ